MTGAPACAICPLAEGCAARAGGSPEGYPRKATKAAKPVRRGTIFWLEAEGQVLLVRRPATGLLGGMRALPTGPWTAEDPGLVGAPAPGGWAEAGTGRHVFTHFALEYRVVSAVPCRTTTEDWWPVTELGQAGLPTLFAQAARLALSARTPPASGERALASRDLLRAASA